ncbi:outer membrane beta-barrel protein [Granulicella sp. L60]|jgi:hypothetical protein|uniref:outer membrane beta-barrel protein n=1 Tax=Granulicella sp. L60 TaxID=1641866 RepID=UPI00131E5F8E|nr:outer membrane beta-barrel protein [Granulicella sp. L60]
MQTPISRSRLSNLIGRTAAVTFLAAAGTLGLHAQQSAGTASSLPTIDLKASLAAPLDLSTPTDLNYSSSVGTEETANAETFLTNSDDASQPPPRRRYSRPNYNDSRTNPDGSSKYTFVAGGGFTLPTGGSHNYLSPGWKFQVGGGRNFNKTLGVLVQFDYDHFGFQTNTLNNLLAIYNSLGATDQNGNPLTQLGGSSHVWSFTVDPVINYYTSDTWGAYVTAGLGFYHKTANFTIPGIGESCDPFYGCFQYQANQTIDKYTSNSFGLDGGIGFTYKFSRFAGERFFAEARYVWTDNQPRPFDISGATSYFNAFPQNSARTTYIPVTFGVRF